MLVWLWKPCFLIQRGFRRCLGPNVFTPKEVSLNECDLVGPDQKMGDIVVSPLGLEGNYDDRFME